MVEPEWDVDSDSKEPSGEADAWANTSEDIIGEGTGEPGPGVTLDESILEKLREANVPKAGEDDEELREEDFINLVGTMEDQRRERDEYFRQHPELEQPVNETLLFEIRTQNLTCVRDMLARGADPNFCTEDNRSALELACVDGDTAIVETLLDYGANVNPANNHLNTPLHIAAEFGHDDVIKLLVARGANISARNM